MTRTPEKIKEVIIKKDLDLNNPEDKAKILELGKTLKEYQSRTRPNPIEFYGHPIVFPKQSPEDREKYKDFVSNPVIESVGFGVHWSVIQYCADFGILTKKSGNWEAVAAQSGYDENGMPSYSLSSFTDFKMKWRGLGKLHSRRMFAEKMNKEIPYETPKELFKEIPTERLDGEHLY